MAQPHGFDRAVALALDALPLSRGNGGTQIGWNGTFLAGFGAAMKPQGLVVAVGVAVGLYDRSKSMLQPVDAWSGPLLSLGSSLRYAPILVLAHIKQFHTHM